MNRALVRVRFLVHARAACVSEDGILQGEHYPHAELAKNGFYVPSGLGLTNEQVVDVSETLKSYHLGGRCISHRSSSCCRRWLFPYWYDQTIDALDH